MDNRMRSMGEYSRVTKQKSSTEKESGYERDFVTEI